MVKRVDPPNPIGNVSALPREPEGGTEISRRDNRADSFEWMAA